MRQTSHCVGVGGLSREVGDSDGGDVVAGGAWCGSGWWWWSDDTFCIIIIVSCSCIVF